jgi:DMSO/TMAO reductase YedYZ molybdopterin-dependent catalytic subunit
VRRITTQLVVATLITAAFVATALSGLVLYMPGRLLPVFGASLLEWRAVHEWSALVLTVAVVAHIALNRRRVGQLIVGVWRPAGPPPATPAPRRAQDAPAPAPGSSRDTADDLEEPGAATSGAQPRMRLNRRWFLILGAGAVATVAAALGLARSSSHRAGSGPGSLLENFPVLNVESGPPAVAAASWVVQVDGLVDKSLRLDRTAWLALPRTQETRDFHCVEGWSVDHLGWEGVRVADLLSLAGPQATGQYVTFHAYSGTYLDSLTLTEAQVPETLLADSLDGAPLPPAHGGPLRLVIPTQLGYKNVKWVVRLEVTATRAQGYWESNGDYPAEAPVT